MPKLTIADKGTFTVESGQRLAAAIEACGDDIGHRCGGFARCTTCRVEFVEGEPARMTQAEYNKLKERDLLDVVRLSCQIVVEGDMTVNPLMRVSSMGWTDPGPTLEPTVTPDPALFSREELAHETGEEG